MKMLKESISEIQNVLSDSVGPMAGFVMKEQMKAAGVDPVSPNKASLIKMVDLIEERCLLRLLTPNEAKATSRKMKEIINRHE